MKTRNRKVFGRRRVVIDGGEFIFEMRQGGISIRPKWGRRAKTITFSHLMDTVSGQMRLAV